MAKYIKELKYTDPSTSTDYYVDTRAIKDADNVSQTLKQALDGKQAALPNATTAGQVLKATNTTGGIAWENQSTGYPPDDSTIALNDSNQLKIKDRSITSTQLNANLVCNDLPTEDPSSTKLTTENAVFNGLAGKQDELSEVQKSAVNSGITNTKVSTYDGYASQIAEKATGSISGGVITINGSSITPLTQVTVESYTLTNVVSVTGGTAAMTGGTTELATGVVYLQYE